MHIIQTSKMDRGEESCAVVSSSAHDLCNFNRKRLKSTFNDAVSCNHVLKIYMSHDNNIVQIK